MAIVIQTKTGILAALDNPEIPARTDWTDIRKILVEAKSLLLSGGWIQGQGRNRHGRCLSQAIADSCATTSRTQPEIAFLAYAQTTVRDAHRLLMAEIQKRDPSWAGLGIPHWNDRVERTLDDVIDVIDGAILEIDKLTSANEVDATLAPA